MNIKSRTQNLEHLIDWYTLSHLRPVREHVIFVNDITGVSRHFNYSPSFMNFHDWESDIIEWTMMEHACSKNARHLSRRVLKEHNAF